MRVPHRMMIARIEHIALASADRLRVHVDGTEKLFRRQDLATGDVILAAVLDKANVPVIVPYLYRELQGDYLVGLHEEVEALTESLATPIESAEPICATRAHSYSMTVSSPPLVLQVSMTVNIVCPGASIWSSSMIPTARLALHVSAVDFASLFLAQPDGGEIRTSGSRIKLVSGRQYALREIDVAIESWQSSDSGATRNVTDLEFHSVRENWSMEFNARVRFSGGLRIASDSTGGHSVAMQIDPPLSADYDGPYAPMLAGSLQIDADGGSSVTVQAILNPSIFGDEQLHFLTNAAADTIVKPFESLLIPFF